VRTPTHCSIRPPCCPAQPASAYLQVSSLAALLAVSPAEALDILAAEQVVFGDGQEVLLVSDYLMADWASS
jgi:hypothetical protein